MAGTPDTRVISAEDIDVSIPFTVHEVQVLGSNPCLIEHEKDTPDELHRVVFGFEEPELVQRAADMFGDLGLVVEPKALGGSPDPNFLFMGACYEHSPQLDKLKEAIGNNGRISRGIINKAIGQSWEDPQAPQS